MTNYEKIKQMSVDEMADVYIMLEQLKLIYHNDIAVKERIAFKVSRLNSRIENYKKEL